MSSASHIASRYFQHLEEMGIPYVILHSYNQLSTGITSDIDYAVHHSDLASLPRIQEAFARDHGWLLCQVLRHEFCALYCVLVNPADPSEHLKLDACSHYARNGRVFLRDAELLAGRRKWEQLYIPSAAAEYLYVAIKGFAKAKDLKSLQARLDTLLQEDPAGIATASTRHFGAALPNFGQFSADSNEWTKLRAELYQRHPRTFSLHLRNVFRILSRVLHPTGLHLVLLGPDGAGKSTVGERLLASISACFRSTRSFHFRPKLFRKGTHSDSSQPHKEPPRGLMASFAKVVFYFFETWLGQLALVYPAAIKSTLIVFDRDLRDMLVDQRRYRLRGMNLVLRALLSLIPRAHLTLVFGTAPEVILARKSELSLPELERQLAAYKSLISGKPGCHYVDTAGAPEEATKTAAVHILNFMARRVRRREKIP